MTKVQIIGGSRSPLVWATRMVALEKGLDAEFIDARPHAPEVTAIQPFGKIPVMRHGTVELAESRAIARYLDGLSPHNPLMPRDLVAAAHAEQWVMHFHTEYVPGLLGCYIIQYFFPQGPGGTPDRAAIDAALPRAEKLMAVLERQLEACAYVAGDFTLADLYFGPMLHYMNTLPEGLQMLAASRNVTAYFGRLAQRPAFKATLPPPMPGRAAA